MINCYVYFIYFNDKIIYIGKGTSNRIYKTVHCNKHLKSINKNSINIVKKHTTLSSEEALAIETFMIQKHKPVFNISKNRFYNPKKAIKFVEMINET